MSNSDDPQYADAGEDDILDLAASLGGSLMKDLLADLAVNEDDAQEWLHLEQLERELHHLDLTSAAAQEQQQPQTAAGMIVSSHASAAAHQAFGTGMMYSNPFVVEENEEYANHSALDAWSLSLQKFTASSVAADFLQADSARKQQGQQQQPQQQGTAAPSRPPPGMMLAMEDYDITSTATVPLPLPRGPPPGISATAGKQVISHAAAKLVQDLQTVEEETISPQSPKKSVVVPPPVTLTQDIFKTPDEIETPEEIMENSAISRSEASTPLLVRQLQKGLQAVHETEVLQDDNDDDKEAVSKLQTTSRVPKPLPITPHNSMGYAPSSMKTTPTPQPTPIASKPMNQAALTDAMPSMPLMPPVLAVPLPAWSQPPPVPRRVVFANPHPAAPPIHAGQLVSRYMTARDICYVVHSLMRPLLTAETAGLVSKYHLQYWTRHYPNAPPPAEKNTPKEHPTKDWLAHELASRAKKAQAWSESNQTLGTPSKTNVTRPRALVSVTNRTFNTATTPTDRAGGGSDPSKQRAALWKARIYCDQAYQALQDVTDSWKQHGRAAAQTPLMKLFKCLGIGWQLMAAPVSTTTESTTTTASRTDSTTGTDAAAEVHQQYSVDPTALQLLLQLAKGKVLLARVLEQALLPPMVIPVLLPVALDLQCSSRTASSSSTSKSEEPDVADDRVFGAWTAVLRTLPVIPGEALVTTVSKIQKHPDTALATTARMQCVHALLQRGGELAAAASTGGHHNPAFAKQWAQTEQEFMSILA